MCLSVRLLSEVLRRKTVKLGEGDCSGPGRSSLNASATRCREGVVQGQMESNPYRWSYGSETWLVERCSGAENCDGHTRSSEVTEGPIVVWT